MLKQLKILLAISFGTTVIAVGMFFDNNKSANINESSPLIENFDEILANLNYIEFSNQNDSTIIELINDQWHTLFFPQYLMGDKQKGDLFPQNYQHLYLKIQNHKNNSASFINRDFALARLITTKIFFFSLWAKSIMDSVAQKST